MKTLTRILLPAVLLAAIAAVAAADEEVVKIGGTVYYDYFIDLTDHPEGYTEPTRGFELRRVYFNLTKEWGKALFRYTTDVDPDYGTGNLNVYTKYAYVETATPIPGGKLLIGLHSPQTAGWTEQRWGYRSMAKVINDEYKWSHTSQLGVGLQGKAAGGAFEYYLDLNNGNGYKKPVAADGIGFSARLAAQPAKGVWISGLLDSNTPGGSYPGDDEADIYVEGLAGYEADRYSVFGSFGQYRDAPDDTKSTGLSVFGRYRFMEGTWGVARYDIVDPDTDADNDGFNWLLVGIDYALHPGLFLQPSIRFTSYEADGAETVKSLVFTFYGKI